MSSRVAYALLGLAACFAAQCEAQKPRGGWKEWREDKKDHCVDQGSSNTSIASFDENFTIEDDAGILDEQCTKVRETKQDGSMFEKGLKFKCNHNKEMLMEKFATKDCTGSKDTMRMEKSDAKKFRDGQCADMKEGYGDKKGRRGPPGGPQGGPPGGGHGDKPRRGKFEGPNDLREKLPDCDNAFSGFLVEFDEDEECGRAKKSNPEFKKTFGIKKKEAPTGKKGDFKANACQEISEESNGTDPHDAGMKIECDASDGTLKIRIFDTPDCSGNARDERRMDLGEQKKLKDGQCGKFRQKRKGGEEIQGEKFGHMKKDELPKELLVDCGTPATDTNADGAISMHSTMSMVIASISLLIFSSIHA